MIGEKQQILVTGGAGYVGSWLVPMLQAADYTVLLLQADITDRAALKQELAGVKCSVVIHLAASHSSDEAQLQWVNVSGTNNLIEALDKSSLKRFVYFSSVHVYASLANGVSPYGKSKLQAENLLQDYFTPTDVDLVVFRLSHAYGVPFSRNTTRWSLLFNNLCWQAFETNKIVVKSPAGKKLDLVWLGYVAQVTLKAVTYQVPAGTYNLGSGTPVRIGDVALEVKSAWKQYSGQDAVLELSAPGTAMDDNFQLDCEPLQKYAGAYPGQQFQQEALRIFEFLKQTTV